jgi:CRISPR-associated protein (TIGR03986 family)
MKWPVHKDPPAHHAATAPYNFIPLPERVLTVDAPFDRHDRMDAARHHGVIELTITTETPLYTRCAYPVTEDPDGKQKDVDVDAKQESYHHGDPATPVLPGSSIRGAVRNLVEIVSYARLTRRGEPGTGARVLDERLVHRAVADQQTPPGKRYADRFLKRLGTNIFQYPGPQVKAGWLECNGRTWSIQPAVEHYGVTMIRVPAWRVPDTVLLTINTEEERAVAEPVPCYVAPKAPARFQPRGRDGRPGGLTLEYARTEDVGPRPAEGWVEAYLIPTGRPVRRTLHTAVYARNPAAKPIEISEDLWAQWDEDQRLQRGLPNREVLVGQPVFYLWEDGELTFLGPCLFFRVPYQRWTLDYVPAATLGGAAAPLDLVESIFGTVNDGIRKPGSTEGAHRGRVAFDDAVCVTLNPMLPQGRCTPGVLSTPKPTSYQLYLVQPKDLGPDDRSRKNNLMSYDEPTPDSKAGPATALRGFKRYWHRGIGAPEAGPAVVDGVGPDRSGPGLYLKKPVVHKPQFTRIHPVRAKVEFRGRVRFENLDDVELGALLFALDLPPTCRHHLGMGKPLGMGSVRIAAQLRLYEPKARYTSLGSLGWVPEPQRAAAQARAKAAFCNRVARHHDDAVESPKANPANLWDIPRLAALRAMLEWDAKPPRIATRPQGLQEFRSRKVLPSPVAVRGSTAASVVADVPTDPKTPAATTRSVAEKSETKEARNPGRVVEGHVRAFEYNRILLITTDGMQHSLLHDIRVFPLDRWKKFNSVNFAKGRKVRITFEGDAVAKVEPTD